MGIWKNFFSKLNLVVSKPDVDETLENIIPLFQKLEEQLNDYKLYSTEHKVSSDAIKNLTNAFYKNYQHKVGRSKNFFEDVAVSLTDVKANLEHVSAYLEEHLPKQAIGPSLSLKKGFSIAYISNTEFAIDYLLKFLDFYVSEEMGREATVSKATRDSVVSDILKFTRLFNDLSVPKDKFIKKFSELADIVVDDYNEELVLHNDSSKFSLNTFMGFRYSPVFFIRKLTATATANRYKYRKEKIKQLQLRLKYLESTIAGVENPVLEKEIEFLTSRVETMESQNYELEREVGGN